MAVWRRESAAFAAPENEELWWETEPDAGLTHLDSLAIEECHPPSESLQVIEFVSHSIFWAPAIFCHLCLHNEGYPKGYTFVWEIT